MNKEFAPIPDHVESVARQVIDSAMAVHRALGPGLLESVYELCLCHELTNRGIPFESQLHVPVAYGDLCLDTDLRIDLLVNNCVVTELKAVDQVLPLFEAQLLTYLKLAEKRVGLLINFNVPLLKHGIRRMVR